MKHIIGIALFCLILPLSAHTDHSGLLEKTADFFEWLEKHSAKFGKCEPLDKGSYYELCDKTRVDKKELKKLFELTPENLIKALKEKNLKIEVLCDSKKENTSKNTFEQSCITSSNRKMFEEVTALHGKFLPKENTILIRSSASKGSLIHEYIHALQSANQFKVYNRIYKKERNQIQDKLTELMDENIQAVKNSGSKKNQLASNSALKKFLLASQMLRAFAPWQDLIDERGIFLLYLKYGNDFGAKKEDLELAKKNMNFICNNKKIKSLIPVSQCSESN